MYRTLTICIAAALVAGIAEFVDAHGRRPADAGAHGPTSGSLFQRPGGRDEPGFSRRPGFETRRDFREGTGGERGRKE